MYGRSRVNVSWTLLYFYVTCDISYFQDQWYHIKSYCERLDLVFAGFFNHKSVGGSLLFGTLRYQIQRLSHSCYLGRHAMLQRKRCVTTLITPTLLTWETRVIGAKPFVAKCLFQSWPHRVAHATKNKKEKQILKREQQTKFDWLRKLNWLATQQVILACEQSFWAFNFIAIWGSTKSQL